MAEEMKMHIRMDANLFSMGTTMKSY